MPLPDTEFGEQYDNGTILAHAAFLMAAGGVHQRASRSPAVIPVQALAKETLGGATFSRAARIWYRALTTYLAADVNAITNRATLDEKMFQQIRNGCVKAATDLYGAASVERKTTELAFYAVGLQPTASDYGADVTCMPPAQEWSQSRPYLGGIYGTCPDWVSVDLFVNNDGATSEWNALVNVIDGRGNPTHFENTVYCRVRNLGDLPAQSILVSFFYAPSEHGADDLVAGDRQERDRPDALPLRPGGGSLELPGREPVNAARDRWRQVGHPAAGAGCDRRQLLPAGPADRGGRELLQQRGAVSHRVCALHARYSDPPRIRGHQSICEGDPLDPLLLGGPPRRLAG